MKRIKMQRPYRLTITPLLISLASLIFLAMIIRYQLNPKAPQSAPVEAGIFSAERAFSMLHQLNPEELAHPVDSEANRLVEKALISQLRLLGYQEEVQEIPICRDSGAGRAVCARVRNILVQIQGTSDEPAILLSAHYDSVPAGPGGSDAGVAVGTLLEVARLLSLQPPPRNSIVLLFNEGEELGLLGAKAFMQKHPIAKNLKLAINIEARGSGGKSVMFETGEDSGWLVGHYAQTSPAPLSSSLFYEVYQYLPNDTDLTVFKEFGLQGLNFAHAEREPHYHTPLDNLTNLDKGSLQHHGDNVWGVVNAIKDLDLSQVTPGNQVYTDILGLFVIQWPESISLLVAVLIMLTFLVALWLIRGERTTGLRGLVVAILSIVVVLLLSGIVGMLTQKLVVWLSGNQQPWHANNLPMLISVWAGTALFGLACLRWMVRNIGAVTLLTALMFSWVTMGLAASYWMPGISFLFIIPVALMLPFLLTLPWFTSRYGTNGLIFIAVCAALINAIIFLPIAYVLEIMISYDLTLAIGLVFGFSIIGLMPLVALHQKAVKEFALILLGLLLVFLSAITWTSQQAPYTAWMPQELNIYHYQTAQNKAFVVAGEKGNQLPSSLVDALGPLQSGAIFPWRDRHHYYAETEPLNLKQTALNISDQKIAEKRRQVTINLSSDEALTDIRLYIPVDAGLQAIESFNHSLSYAGETSNRNGFYEYACRGDSCAQLQLKLQLNKTESFKVLVVRFSQGLPVNNRSLKQARGDLATPRHDGDQTVVVAEYEI